MAVNRDTTIRKLVSLPRDMVDAISQYRYGNQIPTESEAIRRLIEIGLKSLERWPPYHRKMSDS